MRKYTEKMLRNMVAAGVAVDVTRADDKEDPFCVTDYNKNIMAWLAYEEVARELMDELEQMGD